MNKRTIGSMILIACLHVGCGDSSAQKELLRIERRREAQESLDRIRKEKKEFSELYTKLQQSGGATPENEAQYRQTMDKLRKDESAMQEIFNETAP